MKKNIAKLYASAVFCALTFCTILYSSAPKLIAPPTTAAPNPESSDPLISVPAASIHDCASSTAASISNSAASAVAIDQTTTLGRLIASKCAKPLCASCVSHTNNLILAGKGLKGGFKSLKEAIAKKEKEEKEMLAFAYDVGAKMPYPLAVQMLISPEPTKSSIAQNNRKKCEAANAAIAEKIAAAGNVDKTMDALTVQYKFKDLESAGSTAYVNFFAYSSSTARAALDAAVAERKVETVNDMLDLL